MSEIALHELVRNQAQQQLVLLTTKARAQKYANGCVCEKTLRCLAMLYAVIHTLTYRGATLTYHEIEELSNELKACGYTTLPYRAFTLTTYSTYENCDCLPAPHQHPMSDVIGLENRLYELEKQETTVTGDYLPLNNPDGNTVAYGTDGAIDLYENGFEWEDYNTSGAGYYLNGEANAYIPNKAVFGALMRLLAVKGAQQAGVIPYVTATEQGVLVRTTDGTTTYDWDFRSDGKLYANGVEFTGGGSGGGITQTQLDTAIQNIKPTGLTTFTATNTFDQNKVMKLGGTGFNSNVTLDNAASGNLVDTYLTVYVTGNGVNTVSLGAGWKGIGTYNPASGVLNEIVMRYIDSDIKTYTITQPQ